MQRTSFEDMTCSVAQTLDVVGEWWSLLIVRDAFLGVTRFDDFQARLGISRNILTRRLTHLVDNGILKRAPYQDHPPRSEYRLTDKGRDLWHVVTAMRQWGDRWAARGDQAYRLRAHRHCRAHMLALRRATRRALGHRRPGTRRLRGRLRPNPAVCNNVASRTGPSVVTGGGDRAFLVALVSGKDPQASAQLSRSLAGPSGSLAILSRRQLGPVSPVQRPLARRAEHEHT